MKVERNLEKVLKDQLNLLKSLCDNYDNGVFDSVKCMSVIFRMLFYDPVGRNESLLSQLGIKDKVRMYDFSAPRNSFSFFEFGDGISNLIIQHFSDFYCGLVGKTIKKRPEGKYQFRFYPLCESPKYGDHEEYCKLHRERKTISEWSNGCIYEVNDIVLNRGTLIFTMCNKDGGAHFELSPQDSAKNRNKRSLKNFENYLAFRDDQAIHLIVNGEDVRFVNDPAYPAIRQIAREVLVSLEEYM